jgi:hypothetical protein
MANANLALKEARIEAREPRSSLHVSVLMAAVRVDAGFEGVTRRSPAETERSHAVPSFRGDVGA